MGSQRVLFWRMINMRLNSSSKSSLPSLFLVPTPQMPTLQSFLCPMSVTAVTNDCAATIPKSTTLPLGSNLSPMHRHFIPKFCPMIHLQLFSHHLAAVNTGTSLYQLLYGENASQQRCSSFFMLCLETVSERPISLTVASKWSLAQAQTMTCVSHFI